MHNLNYVTIPEAAALSGIDADILERRCEVGVLQAIRRDNEWWIPRSELVTYSAPFRDVILNNLIYLAQQGVNVPVSLLVNSMMLSGYLVSIRAYTLACRNDVHEWIEQTVHDDTEAANLVTMMDQLIKGTGHEHIADEKLYELETDPTYYSYCHLAEPHVCQDGKEELLTDKILRIPVGSIQGFHFGHAF